MAVYAMYCQLLLLACLVATAKADVWDDFSNNLATDLAPIIALFGEQTTKQFLSESTTLLDNFIFAMAPLGILTAVVSVIRVCGGASLRAFIGRAQEGGGIAEAELCSSTSRDVCELYHNGAIVRVFGRSKILEIVHDSDRVELPERGIYSFQDYIRTFNLQDIGWEEESRKDNPLNLGTLRKGLAKLKCGMKSQWQSWFSAGRGGINQRKTSPSARRDDIESQPISSSNTTDNGAELRQTSPNAGGDGNEQRKPSPKSQKNEHQFAPSPNLSFNIGIRELPDSVLLLAGITGFLIQAAVLVFAYLVTYTWHWKKENALTHNLAFPLMILGTLLQSSGMFFCAFLISNSTEERVFRKVKERGSKVLKKSSKELRKGIEAIKRGSEAMKRGSEAMKSGSEAMRKRSEAIEKGREAIDKGSEFLKQGSEALNSSREKIKKGGVKFYVVQPGNQVVGDQTFDSFLFTDVNRPLTKYTTSWKKQEKKQESEQKRVHEREQEDRTSTCNQQKTKELQTCLATGITLTGFVLQFIGLRSMHSSISVFQLGAILIMSAIRSGLRTQRLGSEQNPWNDCLDEVQGHELDWLALEMARDFSKRPAKENPLWLVAGGPVNLQSSDQGGCNLHMLSQRAFFYRARLAELTTDPKLVKSISSSAWEENHVQVRQQAQQLKRAIDSSANILFKLKSPESIPWAINVVTHDQPQTPEALNIELLLHQDHSQQSVACDVNQSYLEAVLGLWTWSIISNSHMEQLDKFKLQASEVLAAPAYRIMATGTTSEDIKRTKKELALWTADFTPSSKIELWKPEKDPPHLGPLSRWARMGVATSETTGEPTCGESSSEIKRRRFHGWQTVEQTDSVDSTTELWALTTAVNHAIPIACAHDIYQSFLFAALGKVDHIGGKTSISTVSKDYSFTNEVIGRLAECFERSDLGSTQDAYSIIIPTLRCKNKLFYPEIALQNAYDDAEKRRKKGDFDNAESILQWIFNFSQDAKHEEFSADTLLELGELYRYALFQNDSDRQELGRNGIKWMKEVTKNQSRSSPVASVTRRYEKLERLSKSSWTGDQRNIDIKFMDERAHALWRISEDKDLKRPDGGGRTILSLAAQKGWLEIVKAVLDSDISMIDESDNAGRTPLSYAAEEGHIDVVRRLLKRGAKPYVEDSSRRAPLSYAVCSGHIDVMESLLKDDRVSVRKKNSDGQSLLHWAARYGQHTAIKWLLERGANIFLSRTDGDVNSVMIAALSNYHAATIEYFIDYRAHLDVSIERTDEWKRALSRGEWKCIAPLLRDINRQCREERVIVVTIGPLDQPPKNANSGGSQPSDSESVTMVRGLTNDGQEAAITMDTIRTVISGQCSISMVVSKKGFLPDKMPSENEMCQIDAALIPQLVELLLKQLGDADKVTESDLQAAAKNEDSGEKLLQLLLNRTKDTALITKDVLLSAVRNWSSGLAITKLLLSKTAEKPKHTGDAIPIAAEQGQDDEIIILERKDVSTMEKFLKAAAENQESGDAILELLLARTNNPAIITENVVLSAVQNQVSGGFIIKLLLKRPGDEFPLTDEIVNTAASNRDCGDELIRLFLDQKGDKVQLTDEIVRTAARNWGCGDEIIRLFLEKRADQVQITEEIMQTAAANWGCGDELTRLFLEKGGHRVRITESIVLEVAANYECGELIMRSLLDHRGDELIVTKIIAETATLNSRSGAIVELLLDRKWQDVEKVLPSIVQAAAENTFSGETILKLLLDRTGDKISITETVVQAAAENLSSGEAIMRLLLDRRLSAVKITEKVIVKVAKNDSSGKEILELLLDRKQDDVRGIEITEAIIEAVASNWDHGEAILRLLLKGREDEIKKVEITDAIVTAAVKDWQKSGEAVLRLLLEGRENGSKDIKITEAVVIAAACSSNGEAVLEKLLEGREDEIKKVEITDAIVTAAVKDWRRSGGAVLRLLLGGRENGFRDIEITEAVVIAAMKRWDGEKILELLLKGRENEVKKFKITEAIVKAAIKEWNGEATLRLLLNGNWDESELTKDARDAIEKNDFARYAIEKLLRNREVGKVTDTEQPVQTD